LPSGWFCPKQRNLSLMPAFNRMEGAQADVHRLLGQCLVMVQRYEGLSKAILSVTEVTAQDGNLLKPQTEPAARFAQMTLGGLVGQMAGSFLAPMDLPDANVAEPDAPFAIKLRLQLPPETFARIETELRELVDLRNRMVHHFLEDHDLESEIGCQRAKVALAVSLARISAAYATLREWAGDMARAREAMAAHLARPEFQDFIAPGRIPWPDTQIAQALYASALELRAGDWTPVEAAVAWVTARYPDEMPDGYGCKTWRQVIHQSRLFDLEYRQDGPRRIAQFRPRFAQKPLT
jgi:hypothetical protein